MSVPRGFALVIGDLDGAGWRWTGFSYRGTVERTQNVDGHQETTEHPCVHTIVTGCHAGADLALWMHWTDGKWTSGWSRRWEDVAAVAVGSRAVRPLVRLEQPAPRWVRPDLNAPRKAGGPPRWDEGGPAAELARINAKRVAGGFDPLPELETR